MNYSRALNEYQKVDLHTSVEDASPHKLIDLLFTGFTTRVAEAKVAILNDKTELKGEKITKAIEILSGLRSALDFDQGLDIAEKLDSMYDYMARQLVVANAQSNLEICDEVIELMSTIQSGWNAIKEGENLD
jgi:flagellar protein FliS